MKEWEHCSVEHKARGDQSNTTEVSCPRPSVYLYSGLCGWQPPRQGRCWAHVPSQVTAESCWAYGRQRVQRKGMNHSCGTVTRSHSSNKGWK